MALENTVASYEIQIHRSGDGAQLATLDLKALNAALKDLNKPAQEASSALDSIHESGLLGRDALHAFNGVALLSGTEHMPILREAVMATHGAMNLLRNSSEALGISVGAMAATFGIVGAAIGTGMLIFNSYREEMKKNEEQAKSTATALQAVPDMISKIADAQKAGAITSAQAGSWMFQLGHPGPAQPFEFNPNNVNTNFNFASLANLPPQNFAINQQPGKFQPGPSGLTTATSLADVQRQMREAGVLDANNNLNPELEALQKIKELQEKLNLETLDGFAKQRAEAEKNYNERIQQINNLTAMAGKKTTPGEADQLAKTADDALQLKLNAISLAETNKEIAEGAKTAFKQLEDDVTEFTLSAAGQRTGAALQEYRMREAGLQKMYYDGLVDNQQYNEKIMAAETKLRAGQLAEDQAFQKERDAGTLSDEKEFEQKMQLMQLTSKDNRVNVARQEYAARVEFYNLLYEEGKITEDELTQKLQQAAIERKKIEQQAANQSQINLLTLQQMYTTTANSFATGFANALGAFVNGTKSAKEAFTDFAKSFLTQIAAMIVQQEILAAWKAVASALGNGGTVTANAGGGVTYAASGLAGVSSVSSPTFFPKFNVVAGEAGREMLTVLARPRMMEIGGIQTVVGQAGRNTLAISNYNDLADSAGRGAGGGDLHIRITHSEDAKAEIVSSSIKGAVLTVTKEAQRSGPLRKALKTVTK